MAIIARLFSHLILLSCIFVQYALTLNETNYILCTARCPQFTHRFAELSTIPRECQEEDNKESIYVNASTCGITYRINYDREEVYVDFIASNTTSDSDEPSPLESLTQNVRWNLNDRSGYNSGEITRTYSCSLKEDCARDFYLKTVATLADDGKNKLDEIKHKLYNSTTLFGEHSRRRCTDSSKTGNKTTTKCHYGSCYARQETFAIDQEKNSKTQRCEQTREFFLHSEIHRQVPKSTRDKVLIEFVCDKNVCNRDHLITRIHNLLEDYTQWNRDEQEETTPAGADAVADDTAAVTPKAAPSLAIKGTLSSSLVLSFIILIQFFI